MKTTICVCCIEHHRLPASTISQGIFFAGRPRSMSPHPQRCASRRAKGEDSPATIWCCDAMESTGTVVIYEYRIRWVNFLGAFSNPIIGYLWYLSNYVAQIQGYFTPRVTMLLLQDPVYPHPWMIIIPSIWR